MIPTDVQSLEDAYQRNHALPCPGWVLLHVLGGVTELRSGLLLDGDSPLRIKTGFFSMSPNAGRRDGWSKIAEIERPSSSGLATTASLTISEGNHLNSVLRRGSAGYDRVNLSLSCSIPRRFAGDCNLYMNNVQESNPHVRGDP